MKAPALFPQGLSRNQMHRLLQDGHHDQQSDRHKEYVVIGPVI
jgi:hypothetical protein